MTSSRELICTLCIVWCVAACESNEGGGPHTCQPDASNAEAGWITIQPGSFTFGSPVEGTPCRGKITETEVEVRLTRAFVMASTEVTQRQWEALCLQNPTPKNQRGPDYPITTVNWWEALAYCNALSAAAGLESCYNLAGCTGTIGLGCPDSWSESCHTPQPPEPASCPTDGGHCVEDGFVCRDRESVRKYPNVYECPGYRLPTVAEWEYAAKAGTSTHTYVGNITTDDNGCVFDQAVEPIAWYCNNADHAMPVAQKPPNPWGLYDMLGNTREWLDFVYTGLSLESNEGKTGPLTDPIGIPLGRFNGERRGLHGGSWTRKACRVKASNHTGPLPYYRNYDYGLRPVRTIQK